MGSKSNTGRDRPRRKGERGRPLLRPGPTRPVTDDPLFPRRPRRRSVWHRPGVPRHAHGRFEWLLRALLAVFALGWGYGIVQAANRGGGLTRGLTSSPFGGDGSSEVTFLLNTLVRETRDDVPLRGRSGALRVVIPEPGEGPPVPDSVASDVALELVPAPRGRVDSTAPPPTDAAVPLTSAGDLGPGVWALSLRSGESARTVPDLRVLTQLPMSEKRGGRIGSYRLGRWPFEGRAAAPGYETPRGVIRVGKGDVGLPVSEHFTLGDFLTKGQWSVWPKYVVLSPRLLDKLELTIQELEAMGHPVENAGVISGFRTPHYNAHGGSTSGRGTLSRHMYGDAMDFYVDNDGDGCMDDLTGDGRVTATDARVVARAADRVERKYPELAGGIGTYGPTGAHCGFVHVDARGHRARW